jgi:LytS/YehU family sensor histidine kinase
MSAIRKLRAILTMGVVSGVFWGAASVLGFAGYQLLKHGTLGFSAILFVPTVIIGFVGGILYATALSLLPRRDDSPGLSPWHSALIGALGGVVMMGLILLVLLRSASDFHLLSAVVFPVSVFAILGAATGYAISDTAKRGALPKVEEPRPPLMP